MEQIIERSESVTLKPYEYQNTPQDTWKLEILTI